MHMLTERLQILVTKEQRRELEAEARRRATSVGSLVREAIDARFSVVGEAERLQAAAEIASMAGTFVEPDELERIVEDERISSALQLDAR